jgi:hypothetical protein
MTRRASDYYPTPATAGWALAAWLAPRRTCHALLDPAAGAGALLRWVGPSFPGATRHAIELQPVLCGLIERPEGLRAGVHAITGDALDPDIRWPDGAIVANPPFGLLDPFLRRILAQVATGAARWAAVLTRIGYLGDAGRHEWARPAAILWMPWRLDFLGDGASDSTTHCWLLYWRGHTGPTAVEWLGRPAESEEDVAWCRRTMAIVDGADLLGEQGSLI